MDRPAQLLPSLDDYADEGKMTSEPITYISINLGSTVGANDSIVGVRVVPDKRDGNVVYGRTLNAGEPDTGEGIIRNEGDQLVFPSGSVSVTLEDVDRYAEPEPDGYAAVTNTVWTWLQVPPYPNETFFHYMLAASRRLDQAYARWTSALSQLEHRPDEPSNKTRERAFDALGNAELMCNALNRAVDMLNDAPNKLRVKTDVPVELNNVQTGLVSIRDAFEHINERAMGRARREGTVDALSIFDQGDLVTQGLLTYAGHSLNLRTEVLPLLMAARKFVYDVVAERGTRKTITEEMVFFPTGDDPDASSASGDVP